MDNFTRVLKGCAYDGENLNLKANIKKTLAVKSCNLKKNEKG